MPYNNLIGLRLLKSQEFIDWYAQCNERTKKIVDGRLARILKEGHFGTVNRFEGITELKWKSGLRVYTAVVKPNLYVLLGGNKNGQEKDIKQAEKILSEIISS